MVLWRITLLSLTLSLMMMFFYRAAVVMWLPGCSRL